MPVSGDQNDSRPAADGPARKGRDAAIAASDEGSRAFASHDFVEATRCYERAVTALGPDADDIAPSIYENLGLAHFNSGRIQAATHAFLRALDGQLESREQSLRFLVSCVARLYWMHDAERYLAVYEEHFGSHPHGWTWEGLEEWREATRQRRARFEPC